MANTAARLLYFHLQTQEQIHCGPTISHFKRGLRIQSVWIGLDQIKRKATDEKENANNNNKNQLYLRNHTV